MKKIIALFIALVMVLSLCSCSGISAEERKAANEIIEKLDTVYTRHQNANEDVLTANTLTSSTGCATKMTSLTAQLEYISHDEFVEAFATVVALLAEEEGNEDPDAVYEWCVNMENPSDLFYVFNDEYVPTACGMAIQAHASVLSGTDEILEQAQNDLKAFAENYPDSELLAALEAYCKAVASFSGYCSEYAFLITDSAASEIRILESICETSKAMIEGSDSELLENAQLYDSEE